MTRLTIASIAILAVLGLRSSSAFKTIHVSLNDQRAFNPEMSRLDTIAQNKLNLVGKIQRSPSCTLKATDSSPTFSQPLPLREETQSDGSIVTDTAGMSWIPVGGPPRSSPPGDGPVELRTHPQTDSMGFVSIPVGAPRV
mmetsp:Transcript_57762/g.118203  ORF Transcript_57762/g.118203 Transcript_57762/m.118203 type:complete len:140 (-) Transcript_57762:80-499(-)|eukprot:CAMPEP_0181324730 /NCGR_PEP_ID=MMETSP1101-20121128/20526_1 /TAXON_ID=46948 /ORGANISM="Rhodomonas abbreviata, Strain Caron Lab Isolate" /LENGTH=139 /DNA_ID=CAMNT_0023432947 /DNA_START=213 /DNA_END=632 /DNA_ORIENTATION=+